MVEEPCFLRTKKERIHKSSFYSIASSLKKCKPFFNFFPDFSVFHASAYNDLFSCIPVTSIFTSSFLPLSQNRYQPDPPVRSTFFFSSSHLSQTSTSQLVSSDSNTLWVFRVSFEIRHLRRLSRGSADPREYSRSWWLAQSYPAHVADRGNQLAGASPLR